MMIFINKFNLDREIFPSKKSYLNGNGYFSIIKLFDELDSQNQLLMNLRKNRWLVSEANLYLYVDQDFYISQNVDPIERLYLFNYKKWVTCN